MIGKKIEELKEMLKQNSSLVGSRQEHIVFPKFTLEKMREVEGILFREFEISGKSQVIGLAILFLLDAVNNNKENDGK